MKKTCGIYQIENKKNGRKYIGQSVHVEQRWRQHIRGLEKGAHTNHRLQRDYDVGGIEQFSFVLLEPVSPERLAERETFWISQKKSMTQEGGYNIILPRERSKKSFTKTASKPSRDTRKTLRVNDDLYEWILQQAERLTKETGEHWSATRFLNRLLMVTRKEYEETGKLLGIDR
jgi:group I intron endonuclease